MDNENGRHSLWRPFLFFQVAWLLSAAPEAEGESALGYLPSQGQKIASIRFRIIMHIGWLSLIPLEGSPICLFVAMSRFDTLPVLTHNAVLFMRAFKPGSCHR
jgi:hypothetical protein